MLKLGQDTTVFTTTHRKSAMFFFFYNDKNSRSHHWVSSQKVIQFQAKWKLIQPINYEEADVTHLVLSSVILLS